MHSKKAVFNWSGGKDSALALKKILKNKDYKIVALLTTFNLETSNSSAHSIPLALIEQQAEQIGIPLYPIFLSKKSHDYVNKMLKAVDHFKSKGVSAFVFGDIFLSDIRKYREDQLNPSNIEVVEPLWGKTSEEVMLDFFESDLKAKIVTTQADKLNEYYIGKELDQDLIKSYPNDVDVCGENGEYHSFVYAGSIFQKEIDFKIIKSYKLSFDIKLESGEVKTYEYWQAEFAKSLN